MEIMNNLTLLKNDSDPNDIKLTPKTKISDHVICNSCGKGIWIPCNPDAEFNHGFTCSNCGEHANFDFGNIIVD